MTPYRSMASVGRRRSTPAARPVPRIVTLGWFALGLAVLATCLHQCVTMTALPFPP
jgi:hypothetical protein